MSIVSAAKVGMALLRAQGRGLRTRTWRNLPTPSYIAHRGGPVWAPENTMAAYEVAAALGYPIEVDVYETKDGVFVCRHDLDLSLKSDAVGNVTNVLYSHIANADAGTWFSPEFAGEPIPTLEDVLERLGGRALLIIDIKTLQSAQSYDRIASMVAERNLHNYVLLQSNSVTHINRMLAVDPSLLTCFLYAATPPWDSISRCFAVSIDYNVVNASMVAEAHNRGMKFIAWTPRKRSERDTLLSYGVDWIIADDPEYVEGRYSFALPLTLPVGKGYFGTGWSVDNGLLSPERFMVQPDRWFGRRVPPTGNTSVGFWAYQLPTDNVKITFDMAWRALAADSGRYATIALVNNIESWNGYITAETNQPVLMFHITQSGIGWIEKVVPGTWTRMASLGGFVPSWGVDVVKSFEITIAGSTITFRNVTDNLSLQADDSEVRGGYLWFRIQMDIGVEFRNVTVSAI